MKMLMDKQSGLTFLELISAVSVLGVLSTFAVPSYSYMMTNNLMTTQSNQLLTSMLFARSEAAKRGVPVLVCKSEADLKTCNSDHDNRSGWNQGWIVYADLDRDGSYSVEQDLMLRSNSSVDAATDIVASKDMSNFVAYVPDGRSNASGHFTFCDSTHNNQYTRELVIGPTGRPSVHKQGDCS